MKAVEPMLRNVSARLPHIGKIHVTHAMKKLMKRNLPTKILVAAWLKASKYISSLMARGRPRSVELIIFARYVVSV